MNPARTGRCQVGKKELSVLSCPQRTAGASKKKKKKIKNERKNKSVYGHKRTQTKRAKGGKRNNQQTI